MTFSQPRPKHRETPSRGTSGTASDKPNIGVARSPMSQRTTVASSVDTDGREGHERHSTSTVYSRVAEGAEVLGVSLRMRRRRPREVRGLLGLASRYRVRVERTTPGRLEAEFRHDRLTALRRGRTRASAWAEARSSVDCRLFFRLPSLRRPASTAWQNQLGGTPWDVGYSIKAFKSTCSPSTYSTIFPTPLLTTNTTSTTACFNSTPSSS